jgi:oxygen-independent coproporphyrinogen-3 oxidase
MVPAYVDAMLKEIDMYHKLFGKIDISSIYIGGGTPTLLIDELGSICRSLGENFSVKGDVCIETNPEDITPELIEKLKDNNVTLVSVGAQSFLGKHLQFIGRNYPPSVVDRAMQQLLKSNFRSVNIDLLFALPGQTEKDVIYDLEKAIDSGVNQVTAYPLFTFPYTSVGRYLKLKNVKMPNLAVRHRQYHRIYKFLTSKGFNRVSVWGFKKGDAPRYSSVTRDNYIGLGAGAGSHLPDGFYLNTFSVEEYTKKCLSDKFPVALHMNFTENMQKYFWLYWRFYDTYICKDELHKKFGFEDEKINRLFSVFKSLNLIRENEMNYELTMSGSFWIHLLQNFFSLRYINKVWSVAIKEAYPSEISL